jgi:hypothetical protein
MDPIETQTAEAGTPAWWLGRLHARLVARQPEMQTFDQYYHGTQPLEFLTAKLLDAFGATFRGLSFNYCGVVVDALAERLEVQGFRFGENRNAADAAWAIWQDNGLDGAFARGLKSGLVKGEFALIVWGETNGRPIITVEDGAEVIVAVDPGDRSVRRAALKRWYDEDAQKLHATLYLPDALYKFQAALDGGSITGQVSERLTWEPREVEGEPWPLPNPLKVVPVIPLPNRPTLAGAGTSELAAIIPIQKAINANMVEALLAGQFSAFRQKYATNVVLETDPDTGKPVEPWKIAQDKLLIAPPPDDGDPEVNFGEFSQTDLSGYIKFHEASVQAMATISRTPPHYFLGSSGVFPSGEALRSAETGLTAKARDRARDHMEPVEEAMRLAMAWRGQRDTQYAAWARSADMESDWIDPETKTESEHIDALVKLTSLGVPPRALWPRVPFTPQEIARIEAMQQPEPAGAGQNLTDTEGQ